MKTAAKCATMWLYNHGMISSTATGWMFSTFDLEAA